MARRATAATVQQLEPLLAQVRALGIDGLVEKANGALYRRSRPILHFHEDADAVYADVKVAGVWQRVTVGSAAGDDEVLALLRAEHVSVSSPQASPRRIS